MPSDSTTSVEAKPRTVRLTVGASFGVGELARVGVSGVEVECQITATEDGAIVVSVMRSALKVRPSKKVRRA